ncbi:MAG: hypothetical protein ACWGOX_15925 [Desulforhopalus sp.]
MNDTRKIDITEPSPISFDDLRMKQSVRTTFKLPREISDLLGLIAGQLGIKQKSLLDQLTQDSRLLDRLAQEPGTPKSTEGTRHPKTYVISRSALQSINDVAKRQKIPRDILVEISIKRLLPIIEAELERHIERKKIFKEMKNQMRHVATLRDRAGKVLGEDDEFFAMIDKQAELAQKNIEAANLIIKKGMPMEEW